MHLKLNVDGHAAQVNSADMNLTTPEFFRRGWSLVVNLGTGRSIHTNLEILIIMTDP